MYKTRSYYWCSVSSAAGHLGVHPNTVKRWVKQRKLPGRRHGSRGHWRVGLPRVQVPRRYHHLYFKPFGAEKAYFPIDEALYIATGLVVPTVRETLRSIAGFVAYYGPRRARKSRKVANPLVRAVIRDQLHRRLRSLPKPRRVYLPDGKLDTSPDRADAILMWSTFFNATQWEDPFSWLLNQHTWPTGRLSSRFKPFAAKLGIDRNEIVDSLFFHYYFWLCGHLNKYWTFASSVEYLLEVGPDEFLAKGLMGGKAAPFSQRLLLLTDKQRAILTAFLILRQRQTGRSPAVRLSGRAVDLADRITKGDIRREMKERWGVVMSAAAIANHFRRAPILQEFFVETQKSLSHRQEDDDQRFLRERVTRPILIKQGPARSISVPYEQYMLQNGKVTTKHTSNNDRGTDMPRPLPFQEPRVWTSETSGKDGSDVSSVLHWEELGTVEVSIYIESADGPRLFDRYDLKASESEGLKKDLNRSRSPWAESYYHHTTDGWKKVRLRCRREGGREVLTLKHGQDFLEVACILTPTGQIFSSGGS